MSVIKHNVFSYKNFDSLSKEVIDLAKEIMPDKIIYINFLNDKIQVTMKVSQHDTAVNVKEGDIIPVEEAICNQIDFSNGEPLILSNIKDNNFDEKVNETIKNGNLGSYVGIPITFRDGERFGALCAAHHDEKGFDKKDVQLLKSVAKLFSYYLELEHLAYIDPLTGLNNSQYLLTIHEEILKNGGIVLMLDLDYFKEVNDTFGHLVGDEVLKELGEKLMSFTSNYQDAQAIRLAGDEFLIYIKDDLKLDVIQSDLKALVEKTAVWETQIGNISLSSSVGAIKLKPEGFPDFRTLLKTVDKLLYEAKNNGKNRFVYKCYNK